MTDTDIDEGALVSEWEEEEIEEEEADADAEETEPVAKEEDPVVKKEDVGGDKQKGAAQTVELRLRPGHESDMTIIAATSGNDKVQILSVTGLSCPKGILPRTVCDEVMEKMKENVKDIMGPVRGHKEIFDPLRKIAQAHRKCIIDLHRGVHG